MAVTSLPAGFKKARNSVCAAGLSGLSLRFNNRISRSGILIGTGMTPAAPVGKTEKVAVVKAGAVEEIVAEELPAAE